METNTNLRDKHAIVNLRDIATFTSQLVLQMAISFDDLTLSTGESILVHSALDQDGYLDAPCQMGAVVEQFDLHFSYVQVAPVALPPTKKRRVG